MKPFIVVPKIVDDRRYLEVRLRGEGIQRLTKIMILQPEEPLPPYRERQPGEAVPRSSWPEKSDFLEELKRQLENADTEGKEKFTFTLETQSQIKDFLNLKTIPNLEKEDQSFIDALCVEVEKF